MQQLQVSRGALRQRLLACAAAATLAAQTVAPAFANGADNDTASPIKHVIVIIGENRTFDHLFATYTPKHASDTVFNLLSQGIVNSDGTPGPNYVKATQYTASNYDAFELSPPKTAYTTLPYAFTGGPALPYLCALLPSTISPAPVVKATSCLPAGYKPGTLLPAAWRALVESVENGLDPNSEYQLFTGGTGQAGKVPDARISYNGHDATTLASGPYQLSNAKFPYDSYAASPVHRFFQMWQQQDCNAKKAKAGESAGCDNGLFAWVEQTVGAGSNGKALSQTITNATPIEGATALSFYNMQNGDAHYFKKLADEYSISDNYHQPVNGGTGANSIMLGYADALFFSNGKGKPVTPPNNPVNPAAPTTPLSGYPNSLSEIENPNPQPGTNNFYTQDGYGGTGPSNGAPGAADNYGGGSYVNCSDQTQPGVNAVLGYLSKLPKAINPNCAAGAYYLVNNYNPGYFGDGTNAYTDANSKNYVFTIPPSTVRSIGDSLNDAKISWAYYGDSWNTYLNDKYETNPADTYCNICNWAQYDTAIMTSDVERKTHLADLSDFYTAVQSGNLPAVSYVKPGGLVDGHPASSKFGLFEAFSKKVVDAVQANPALAADTAIMITVDEGGGYWDSGYIQPVDFFGDGTRIPLIVVSPYSKGGHISHSYADHASIIKFIDRNWGLRPITKRSRDNLPNPLTASNPYVPVNTPAIGDLWDMFDFNK